MNVSYATAFIGGLVTILAPCAAMLLPAFFAYACTSRTTLASRTAIFFIGLLVALVPLGTAAGSVGNILTQYRSMIALISGIIIMILGFILALALPFPHISLPWSGSETSHGATPFAVFLLGISYGLAGAGCTGPILGAILLVAGHTGSAFDGAIVMACYAAGMFTPIVVLAFIWDACDIGSKGFLRPRPIQVFGRSTTVGSLIAGIAFIVLGAGLAISGGVTTFSVLDSTQQSSLEAQIMGIFNSIPNWLFAIGLVALILLVIIGFIALGRKRASHKS